MIVETALVFTALLAGVPWEDALQEHQATLGRIQSIHCCLSTEGGRHSADYEMWSSGSRDRVIERIRHGEVDSAEEVRIGTIDGTRGRSLTGWDPENPLTLPLDPARSGEFLSVQGAIGPVRSEGGRQHVWFGMGLDLLPGWSVAEAASVSTVVESNSSESDTEYEIAASSHRFLEGIQFRLSPDHGFLLSRVSMPDGTIGVIEEFRDFGDLHLPARVRRQKGDDETVSELVSCSLNEPIPADMLTLEFPEGARVDEPEAGVIHIWGKDEPRRTFPNEEALHGFVVDAVTESQWPRPEKMPAGRGSSLLFWANIILISLLVGLYFVRRRLITR